MLRLFYLNAHKNRGFPITIFQIARHVVTNVVTNVVYIKNHHHQRLVTALGPSFWACERGCTTTSSGEVPGSRMAWDFYDIDYPRSTLIPSYAKVEKKKHMSHVFSYLMMCPFRWENLSLKAISKPFVYRKMWSQLGTPNRLLADVSQDHEFR